MSSVSFNLKKLYEEKKYKEIVSVIKKIDDKSINSGLLNLLGVCKLLSDKSTETLKDAINDFRNAYLRDKNTEHSFHALKNFINASIDLFDIQFRDNEENLIEDNLKEIFSYFNENQDYF